MRSRILKYKNNLVDYDILTQFPVKNHRLIPTFTSCEIQIKNLQASDPKQLCLNLVSIQFVGNKQSSFVPKKNSFTIKLKDKGINIYFLLEIFLLLAYKNKFKHIPLEQSNNLHNMITVHSKEFLGIIEYFSLHSNFLKSLEKAANSNLSLSISYQLIQKQSKYLNYYFLKSLSYPF